MNFKFYSRALLLSGTALCLFSCQTDETELNKAASEATSKNLKKEITTSFKAKSSEGLQSSLSIEENIISDIKPISLNPDAVAPTPCSETQFDKVTSYYTDLLVSDFVKYWDGSATPYYLFLDDYLSINNFAGQLGINGDYFGKNGEFTNYVQNEQRSLEKFWNMPNIVNVYGQHTETLADLEVIQFMYENLSSLLLTDKYADLETILQTASFFNENADQIPENPFYASDAFATRNRTIVIGDGLASMLVDSGLDSKIVWSSILAHEWSHQIQFLNEEQWEYPISEFARTPESTRMTELEADFFTGFYLTHKRGGTYNWKRVQEFLVTFYNIGDCAFESSGHHGTPSQRLASAKAGYELAASLQKNGHLPNPSKVHEEFLQFFSKI